MGVVYQRALREAEPVDYGVINTSVACSIAFSILATIFVAARVYIRRVRGQFDVGDWLIVASLVWLFRPEKPESFAERQSHSHSCMVRRPLF
jgi:hypothetical protein